MDANEQNKAIAKACGWTEIDYFSSIDAWVGTRRDMPCCDIVPDYCGDLNAAITLCDHLAALGWNCELHNGLDRTWECEFMRPPDANTHPDFIGERHGPALEIHYAASDTAAAAISECFLRTLNLWTDQPAADTENGKE